MVVWAGFVWSGVHPTLAGVVLGLLTPVTAWLGPSGFVDEVRSEADALAAGGEDAHHVGARLRRVAQLRREARSPAEDLLERMHPWVAFGIMPVFALANAGVELSHLDFSGAGVTVLLGSSLGLVVGKPVGIALSMWLAVKTRVGALPEGLGTRHLVVLGLVGGVGFTMSLFVAQLAFPAGALLQSAKVGVLGATVVAAVASLLVARTALPLPQERVG